MATTWRHGGYCACGCGQKTNLAPRDHKALGWRKGEPYEYVAQHQNSRRRKGFEVDPETGCHVWQGQRSQRYPSMKVKGLPVKVHQHHWERAHGPVPEGFVLHHRCGNTRCCNVEHLEVVTQAVNAQEGVHTKLSMDKAETIRRLYASGGYTYMKLATMFGVSRGTIENVVYGFTWRPAELHRPIRRSQ